MKELLELGADTELEDFVRLLCQYFRLSRKNSFQICP